MREAIGSIKVVLDSGARPTMNRGLAEQPFCNVELASFPTGSGICDHTMASGFVIRTNRRSVRFQDLLVQGKGLIETIRAFVSLGKYLHRRNCLVVHGAVLCFYCLNQVFVKPHGLFPLPGFSVTFRQILYGIEDLTMPRCKVVLTK